MASASRSPDSFIHDLRDFLNLHQMSCVNSSDWRGICGQAIPVPQSMDFKGRRIVSSSGRNVTHMPTPAHRFASRFSYTSLLVLCGLMAAGAKVNAGIIFNTLDDTQDGLVAMSSANSRWYAQAFSTSATEAEITQVSLDLEAATASDIEVLIYSDNSGQPGNSIGQPLYSANQPIVSPLVIAGLSINLTPSTDYWIVTSRAGGATAFWGYTDDVQFVNAYTSNSGGTWTTVSTDALRMSVTAVPEPATMPLLVSGLAIAAVQRTLRGRRRAARG
jgi:hypothetical protein